VSHDSFKVRCFSCSRRLGDCVHSFLCYCSRVDLSSSTETIAPLASDLRRELIEIYDQHRRLFVPEAQVRAEFDALMTLHAWEPSKIKPEDWLENFDSVELPYALQMLHRFVFYPDHLTDELLASAFHQISGLSARKRTFSDAKSVWNSFCREVVLTYVEGEEPDPTDSGYTFARKARQFLGIQDIRRPEDVVKLLWLGPPRPVVFVDDFVGSGNQFIETWERPVEVESGVFTSFAHLSALSKFGEAFYCNAVSTAVGKERIERRCPDLLVFAGNVISSESSFISKETRQWPAPLRNVAAKFIESLKDRVGYREDDGGEDDWGGFHHLGLGLAFEHSTPDATLPVFRSERNGWRHLVRKV
jgi:hypothetical protein